MYTETYGGDLHVPHAWMNEKCVNEWFCDHLRTLLEWMNANGPKMAVAVNDWMGMDINLAVALNEWFWRMNGEMPVFFALNGFLRMNGQLWMPGLMAD
jgi:hypothetical protein